MYGAVYRGSRLNPSLKVKGRKLSASGKELKIDFVVTMTKDSPKNLIETKVMLLAAGGSAITQEFGTKLDESLQADGLQAVGLTPDAISFVEPLYESLEPAAGSAAAGASGSTTDAD